MACGYTTSGYGFVQDMSYAYIQEFTRTSMAGKIRRFKGGYTSMWNKLSQCLPFEVLCSTTFIKIKRDNVGISVKVKNANGDQKTMDFDIIVLSGALQFKNGRTYRSSTRGDVESEVVELNHLEKELFSKVQTVDYYTTVLKIKGLEHLPKGFFYFGEFIEDPAMIRHPVAVQRFFSDTDIFLFWSYGNSLDIRGSTVAKLAIDTVKSMGGLVEEAVLQRRFKYFPRVNGEGGLMDFELTERNSSYVMTIVCKHFANDNTRPIFPYVKRLFPLVSNNEPRYPRILGELPGAEFPDLPSLGSYLKYWGTHKTTENKILYTWINEEGKVVNQRTYAELHYNASHIGHKLASSVS